MPELPTIGGDTDRAPVNGPSQSSTRVLPRTRNVQAERDDRGGQDDNTRAPIKRIRSRVDQHNGSAAAARARPPCELPPDIRVGPRPNGMTRERLQP